MPSRWTATSSVPRTARAIDLAVGERTDGPVFLAADGRRLDRHGAGRIVRKVTRRAGITKAVTPHTLRHAFITASFNMDVPQEVVRRILDHDSHAMTAHYARLSDTTIRRHWEKARKVSAAGQAVALDPDGALAEAAWAKQRIGRATQALPNG